MEVPARLPAPIVPWVANILAEPDAILVSAESAVRLVAFVIIEVAASPAIEPTPTEAAAPKDSTPSIDRSTPAWPSSLQLSLPWKKLSENTAPSEMCELSLMLPPLKTVDAF